MTTSVPTNSRTRTRRGAALTLAAALALPLAAATTASAAPALTLTSTVAVTGALPATTQYVPVAAEAPDGTVYVATLSGGAQTVWAAKPTGAATRFLAKTGLGATTSLAADATDVYVGSAQGINAFDRGTGALVEHWVLSPKPRALSQLVVAGNRVWALLTPLGYKRAPSSIVELDPTSAARVRTINGVYDTFSLAASTTGIYYVTDKDSTLVRLTNAGASTTAKTHVVVDQVLSGPAALQAVEVRGNVVVVRIDYGQGTDAAVYAYNATSLSGPGKPSPFSAAATLGNTSLGLLTIAFGAATNECPTTIKLECMRRYALGGTGVNGPALNIPYEGSGAVLGPDAALVVTTTTNKERILRIG